MKTLLLQLVGISCLFLHGATAQAADENYVHSFTGFTFPPTVGAFERGKITPYNAEKSDIQVDYYNQPFTVLCSAYVYPANEPLDKHYEECKAAVTQAHPNAALKSEGRIVFDKSGTKYHGYEADYAFPDKFGSSPAPVDILSKVVVFRRDDYFVLFRISYLLSDKQAAEREINDLLQGLAWPPGGSDASAPPSP
jgi:hypothetical protein